jgi:two-component system OmpR family response regulator
VDRTRVLRILCLDNDPDVALVVELALNLDPNIEAVSVGSAAEAILTLYRRTFDLVLLDASIEDTRGLKLLKNVTETDGSPPTPVIFLTADIFHLSRFDKPGVLGVITKPFDPITLADVVRSHIADIDKERLAGT